MVCTCSDCKRLRMRRKRNPLNQRKKRPLHDIFVKAPREKQEE